MNPINKFEFNKIFESDFCHSQRHSASAAACTPESKRTHRPQQWTMSEPITNQPSQVRRCSLLICCWTWTYFCPVHSATVSPVPWSTLGSTCPYTTTVLVPVRCLRAHSWCTQSLFPCIFFLKELGAGAHLCPFQNPRLGARSSATISVQQYV